MGFEGLRIRVATFYRTPTAIILVALIAEWSLRGPCSYSILQETYWMSTQFGVRASVLMT